MIRAIIIFFALVSADVCAQQNGPSLTGSFKLGGYYYSSNSDVSSITPSGYLLSGRMNFRWGDLYVPISAYANDQGLTYSRPFTRIGLSPRYKWATLHLGHRNLKYSTFVLNKRTIYGIGGEINIGKLRLGLMKGKFNDLHDEQRNYNGDPVFDRKGWAARLGIGTERNHFDFVLLTAKDDSNSVSLPSELDSLVISPQQNLVIGFTSSFHLTKQLSIEAEGAASAITRDIAYPSLVEEADFPLSSWANEFRFNATSHGDYAGQAQLNFHNKAFFANLRYRRVMPGFESFGTRFLLKDLESLTFNPGYSFRQGKLIWNMSIGVMKNNLNGFKLAQTNRVIGSSNLVARFGKNLMIFTQYSNYSLNQQVIRDQFTLDSLLVNQISHQISFVPSYTWKRNDAELTASTNLFYQINDDQQGNQVSDQSNNYINVGVLLSYKHLKTLWSFQVSPRYFSYQSSFFTNKRTSLSLTVRKDRGEGRFNFFSTLTLSKVDNAGDQYGDLNFNGRLEYALYKKLVCGASSGLYRDLNRIEGRKEMRSEAFIRWSF